MQKKLILMIIFVFLVIFVIGSAVGAMPLTAVTNPEENTRGYLQYVCQNDRFKYYITKEDIARIIKSPEYEKTGDFKIRVFQEIIIEKHQLSLIINERIKKLTMTNSDFFIKNIKDTKFDFVGFDFVYERESGVAILIKRYVYNFKGEIYLINELNKKYTVGSGGMRYNFPEEAEYVLSQVSDLLRKEYNKTKVKLIDKKPPEYHILKFLDQIQIQHYKYIYEDSKYRYYAIAGSLYLEAKFYLDYKKNSQQYPTHVMSLDIMLAPKTVEVQQELQVRANKLLQGSKIEVREGVLNKNIWGKISNIFYIPESKKLYYMTESFYNEDGEKIYSLNHGYDFDNMPSYHLDEDAYHKNMVRQIHSFLIKKAKEME